MNKSDIMKLELIRMEGICKLILDKVKDEDVLKNKIQQVTNTNIKDTKVALFNLNRYQLINIIKTINNISSKDIDEIYEQYRYGLKPGFTIFSFNTMKKRLTLKEIEEKIKEYLRKVSYIEGANYIKLKYKSYSKIDNDVYEYSFSYLSKYTYISENEEPKYIYEMNETYVWFSEKNLFLSIKNGPDYIIKHLKQIFSEIFEINLYNIKISRKLIEEIFDVSTMKKGSYINMDAGDDEAEKLIIADSKFSEKEGLRNKVKNYDMTSTFLSEKIDDNTESTLGVNCGAGKVYLSKNLTATKFRRWSINTIKQIIAYLSNLENSSDFDIFKTKNIISEDRWNMYNKYQKELLEKICYSIYICTINKSDTITLTDNIIKYNKFLSKYFYQRFTCNCNECDDLFFPRCKCGSSDIILVGEKVMCKACGQEVEEIECEEGHVNKILDIQEIINIIPSQEILEKIKLTLFENFQIEFEGNFFIRGNNLTIIKENKGELLNISDILEFDEVFKIQLNIKEREELQQEFVNDIKEKCRSSNNKACIKCIDTNLKKCIMKMFITYGNYRPSPHQAQEFGDVNFKVTLKTGEKKQFVGIAKSATKNDVLNLSDNSSREMLQQILTMTHDTRVDIIGIICPMKFHDQLIKEIEYLSKITKTKMIILDDRFMVKQLKKYKLLEAESS